MIRYRFFRRHLVLALIWLLLAAGPAAAQAPGIELAALALSKADGELTIDFEAPMTLSKTVRGRLQRGLPVYFVAEADLYRSRWYWRDERVARVQRVWRVAYQPLTSNWRVGFGGFNQSFASLGEALSVVSRSSRWKLAELSLARPRFALLRRIQLPARHHAAAQPDADRPGQPGRMVAGRRAHAAGGMTTASGTIGA